MIPRKKVQIIVAARVFAVIASLSVCFSDYQEKLDRAYDSMYTDYERAISLSAEILSENPEVAGAHWIKSIAYTNLGDLQSDEEKQRKYYEKADKLADRALELDSDDPNAHHAKAIVTGRIAENAGVREGLRLSREVKKYTDRVLELDEEHAGAWFVRGMLMYRIDRLSRFERWIANTLFGGLPFETDRDEAVAALDRAVRLNPKNIYFHLEFGKVLKNYGEKDRAKQVLEAALELEAVAPGDADHLEEAEYLLEQL